MEITYIEHVKKIILLQYTLECGGGVSSGFFFLFFILFLPIFILSTSAHTHTHTHTYIHTVKRENEKIVRINFV